MIKILLLQLLVIPFMIVAQTTPFVLPLWQNGAPGFENRKNEPEQAQDYWVKNIHNPSITVYLAPKDKATGAAVVICPGGGHRLLVFNGEGVAPALFLNSIGVTAIVLKYRLGREANSPYDLTKHPAADARRALRLVRSHANEWGLDTARIGMLGFSAGGEVVSMVAYGDDKKNVTANDAIDKLNGQPNFQLLIYPGPLGIPDTIPANAPPAFMLAANDDVCCSPPIVELLQKYRAAKASIEVHLYAKAGHAFNMGTRSALTSIKTWPQRMADWLADNNFLKPLIVENKK